MPRRISSGCTSRDLDALESLFSRNHRPPRPFPRARASSFYSRVLFASAEIASITAGYFATAGCRVNPEQPACFDSGYPHREAMGEDRVILRHATVWTILETITSSAARANSSPSHIDIDQQNLASLQEVGLRGDLRRNWADCRPMICREHDRATLRIDRFCWVRTFWSHVRSASNPLSSAARSNGPSGKECHPNSLARWTSWFFK